MCVFLFFMGLVEGMFDGLKWLILGLSFVLDGMVGIFNEVEGEIEIFVIVFKFLMILLEVEFEVVIEVLFVCFLCWFVFDR